MPRGPEAFLEEWWAETRDPNPRQRVWKQRYALAGVLAYERTGVLTSEAAARWRTRLTDPHDARIDPGSELSADARARGDTYLGELLHKLTPAPARPGARLCAR